MTTDELREHLLVQITNLVKARDASHDEDEKDAADAAIAAIENTILDLDIAAADELGGKVDALIEELDAVLNEHPLDAVSALGRTFNKVRADLTQE